MGKGGFLGYKPNFVVNDNPGIWTIKEQLEATRKGLWTSGFVAQPAGLSSSFLTETGANASWNLQTVDLSAYAGNDIKLVWKVVIGTAGNVYENDLQLDTIAFDGNTYNFDTDDDGFETTVAGVSKAYEGATWVAIQADNTDEYWCRDTGGTVSSGTGTLTGQSGTHYLYTETSSPVINGDVFWLRSPTISASLGAGNCTFYEGRDVTGATTTLDFYVDVQ